MQMITSPLGSVIHALRDVMISLVPAFIQRETTDLREGNEAYISKRHRRRSQIYTIAYGGRQIVCVKQLAKLEEPA